MIWFFLAGMVAGAVGFDLFVTWAARRIHKKKQMEAFRKNGMHE